MKLRSFAVAVALAAGVVPAVAPQSACAADGAHAVLVVDTEQPGGQYRYCVELPDGSASGIELIQLAGDQHGLQYRLGFGGQAVCQLAGVGAESDDCFERYPEFWGYWRGNDDGEWTWSEQGAGSTIVRDGDVQGWSWSAGNDGSTHAQPPSTRFGSVCEMGTARAARPDRDKSGGARERGAGADVQGGGAPAAAEAAADEGTASAGKDRKPARKDREGVDGRRSKEPSQTPGRVAQATPSASSAPSPTATAASDDGPPVGGLVALGVAMVWVVATAVITRRRRAELGR